MDDQFDIELQSEEMQAESSVQLPQNFLSFGEIENDDVKVYIMQRVYKELEKFAASDTSIELGTILIGDYGTEHGKPYVIISDYIEAKYTDASSSTLTFTHETWDYVHRQHDSLFPYKKIVGWQHTHPNYGIFLSNYDLFIQENFFNLPFQVAYVIDPIQKIRGFFQWKSGKIEKLKGFYIYDDVGKPIKIEKEISSSEKNNRVSSDKIKKGVYLIIALLCVATATLGFLFAILYNKYKVQTVMQNKILTEIEDQRNVIANQEKTIGDLQEQMISDVLGDDGTTTASDLIQKIENHDIKLQNQEEVLKELKAFVEQKKSEDHNAVSFKAYTVAAGDTLLKICSDNDVDYRSNLKIILSINGIENINQIYTGQTILLPILNKNL